METTQSMAFGVVPGAEAMEEPEGVAAMQRLKALGWGSKRIASELGCSRTVEYEAHQESCLAK